MAIEGKRFAEFAADIHTGLGAVSVPEFDDLKTVGMAASLAVQLRGLPEIEYPVLAQVSDAQFDIPASELKGVLRLLKEIGMVNLYEVGKSIEKVDPQVPYFEDVYEKVGDLSKEFRFNEVEQAAVHIMAELFQKPENKDRLIAKSGIDDKLVDRCLQIGGGGRLINEHRNRGRTILVSPLYFADNLEGLTDLIAKTGSADFEAVIRALQVHQGWPLSMIVAERAVAGNPLTPTQIELARMLASENILKPPTIEIGAFSDAFMFTPRPGSARLSPGKREIYEKAMALLAAVRKGQLLPFNFSVNRPAVLLQSFLDKGFLRENTEAFRQYGKVAGAYKVGYFEEVSPGWHRFVLRKTEENIEAVKMAIDLATNESQKVTMRQDPEARALLQQDERYVRSVLGARAIKERERVSPSPAAKEQWEQLTLRLV